MANQLYTIGYEGRGLDDLIAALKDKGIECLVDVREIPLSRKRGFSKSALAERLGRERISYAHFKQLGSPKPVREQLKATKDYAGFFSRMDKYLSAQTDAMELAYQHVSSTTCCLMCFERLAAQCHRTTVAQKLKERNGNDLKVTHI